LIPPFHFRVLTELAPRCHTSYRRKHECPRGVAASATIFEFDTRIQSAHSQIIG
jgi:hypothetical protein